MPATRTHTTPRARAARRGSHARRWHLQHADCLQTLPQLEGASVDAVITDPPYGISFEGKAWDGKQIRQTAKNDSRVREQLPTPRCNCGGSAAGYDFTARGMLAFQAFSAAWAAECMRVLKPGGHIAIFGYPRTFHRLTAGVEQAGLEIRDVLLWLHGQGFPKSWNLTGEAEGWGTALKPAYEPILLARRPLEGRTAENHARHGTGALHIDACRIPHDSERSAGQPPARRPGAADSRGRWPANLVLSHAAECSNGRCCPDCPVGMLGEQHRFYFTAKASRAERDAGCEQLTRHAIETFKIGAENHRRADVVANIHPTVKPLALMRWLVRLLVPDGGLVLDPFTGSGSTGAAAMLEQARFHGIEREDAYLPIARARIRHGDTAGHPASRSRGGCR